MPGTCTTLCASMPNAPIMAARPCFSSLARRSLKVASSVQKFNGSQKPNGSCADLLLFGEVAHHMRHALSAVGAARGSPCQTAHDGDTGRCTNDRAHGAARLEWRLRGRLRSAAESNFPAVL